jgi:rhomboid protease GluP
MATPPEQDPTLDRMRRKARSYFFTTRLIRRTMLPVMLALAPILAWLLFQALAPRGSSGDLHPSALLMGGAVEASLLAEGEIWRLLSPLLVHAGFVHLAVNAIGLLLTAQICENMFGPSRTIFLFTAGGAASSLASAWLLPEASAGASGAVMTLFGAALAFTALRGQEIPGRARWMLVSGMAIVLAVILLQSLGSIRLNSAAHLGGFLFGAVAGSVLRSDLARYQPEASRDSRNWRVFGILCAALLALSFVPALRNLAGYIPMTRPVLFGIQLDGLTVPAPRDWSNGVWIDESCRPVARTVEGSSPPPGRACLRDVFGTSIRIGRAMEIAQGLRIESSMTVMGGLRAPIRQEANGITRRLLFLDATHVVELVGYEVVSRRYDHLLQRIAEGVVFPGSMRPGA